MLNTLPSICFGAYTSKCLVIWCFATIYCMSQRVRGPIAYTHPSTSTMYEKVLDMAGSLTKQARFRTLINESYVNTHLQLAMQNCKSLKNLSGMINQSMALPPKNACTFHECAIVFLDAIHYITMLCGG